MVGLSVVLEGHNKTTDNNNNNNNNKNNYNYVKSSTTPINNPKATLPPPLLLQVINKTNKIINTKTKPSSSSSSSSSSSYNYCYSSSPLPAINFLDSCYLCQKPLLLNKDIFMYRGDRAFCSEECRCRHICMDDEESLRREKCSMLATMKTSSSSASASRASHRKANATTDKNTRAGGFAY
ncbi:hypothetical protein Syun_007947 [Stephania yunnanensis]|uniref:FLZ-type domain-containing protein n=1 Tax=Stephania yunnanensis TaxID=152371 RepID=A0AAP0Q2W7_9MAGN